MTCPTSNSVQQSLLETEGKTALPRQNGELLFAEPWESRAFGLAVTLHDQRAFEWEDFRRRLIARINEWEADPADEQWSYYCCWLQALEDVVIGTGVLSADEVIDRVETLANRPAGYDHGHEHAHSH
ncbi:MULTISPECIES: nitrile hydratase accessory protein [unclassified Streptomyces]|uniref:nitrile hydratase accessory protein n=1 Tax=unclassified Streptomyces TaxID=2593676 RepID=UPI003D93D288